MQYPLPIGTFPTLLISPFPPPLAVPSRAGATKKIWASHTWKAINQNEKGFFLGCVWRGITPLSTGHCSDMAVQGEQFLLSQHHLTTEYSAWNSLAWLICLLNLSAWSVTFSCPSHLLLWELLLSFGKGLGTLTPPPMAVAAYCSHNQNLCMELSVLETLQVFVKSPLIPKPHM